jgi:hypothetical protein
MAYIGIWTVIIMALKFGALRLINGPTPVDIRDLPPAEYQAAIDDMILKAKAEKRKVEFERCMNLNHKEGEYFINKCLGEIGEQKD